MAKTVVVLGGAYGGVHVAHYLLKNTDAKVVLVSTNSHFFVNMASVRSIVPDTFTDKQLFFPLEDSLSRYPSDRYELIIGSAETVDPAAKTVKVGSQTVSYDHLVVATGARNRPPPEAARGGALLPWKADGTYEEITALLATIRTKVAQASTIVVAGGGSTGVEAAGELGYAYGKVPGKKVILLSSGPELLGGDDRLAACALNELKKLNVDVRTGAAVKASRELPDGRIELTVEGAGEEPPIVTDVYLPSMGMIPNTGFLPASLLTSAGAVDVDEFYHAKGVASHDVWAVGDAVSKPRAGFMITQKQAAGVAKNVELALQGKPPVVVKLLPVDLLAVATGQGRGVGRVNSFRLPSLMVWLAKGRTLGTNYLNSYLDGSVA